MKLAREWTGAQALAKRQALGMNQSAFWATALCGQTTGSRYECGRTIPKSVQALLTIAFGTDLQSQETIKGLRG